MQKHETTFQKWLMALMLGASLGASTTAAAGTAALGPYPMLPDRSGPDVRGSDVTIYLRDGSAFIQLGGGLYEIGERALEIAFDGRDEISVWIVILDGDEENTLFITRDGRWTDTLVFHESSFGYILHPDGPTSHGFEIAGPGATAPTRPVIVLVPIEDAPEPR